MQGKFTIVHKILSVFQPFPPEFFPSSGKTSLFPQKFPPRRRFPRPKAPRGHRDPEGSLPRPGPRRQGSPRMVFNRGNAVLARCIRRENRAANRRLKQISIFRISRWKAPGTAKRPPPIGSGPGPENGRKRAVRPSSAGKNPPFRRGILYSGALSPVFCPFPCNGREKFFRPQKAGRPTGVPLFHVFPSEFPVFPLKAPPAGPGAAAPPRAHPPAAGPDRGRAPSPKSKRDPAPSCS